MNPDPRTDDDLFRCARLDATTPALKQRVTAAAHAAWCEMPTHYPAPWSPLMRLAMSVAASVLMLAAGHQVNDLALAKWHGGNLIAPPIEQHTAPNLAAPIDQATLLLVHLTRMHQPHRESGAAILAGRTLVESLADDMALQTPHSSSRRRPGGDPSKTADRLDKAPQASYGLNLEYDV